MSTIVVVNATIYTPDAIIRDGFVIVEDGRITRIGSAGDKPPPADLHTVDGRGGALVPGFIDLQINGGFGRDFTVDPGAIWSVAAQLPLFGVTAFLPTIVTAPLDTTAAAMAVWADKPVQFIGAHPLGLHIEGPFINPEKKGAHNAAYLYEPDAEAVRDWTPANGVRLVTLAPEVPGAMALIQQLVQQGVLVSVGHTMATFEQGIAGFNAGIRYGTHLFNAMAPLHHRQPGVIASLLSDPRPVVGLIADGHHVHPAAVRLAWRALGSRRLNLVTDAMAALGMPAGRYQLGELTVDVDRGTARLSDGTLAGSVVGLDQALRNLISFTGSTLAEALPTVTSTPADLLGLSQKGRLVPGADGDMVLLDDALQVMLTIVGGKVAPQAAAL